MKRGRSIDFLMFLAVLLVVNSHLESMYVEPFKPLATGGVIGDALFLFAFTLLGGAFVGCRRPEIPFGQALALVGLAFVCHYGWLELVGRCPVLMPVRCLLLLPLAAIICSLYYLSKTSVVCRLMDSWGGVVVSALGGLCLEVYISHGMFETAKFNHLFPLNILGFFIIAFLVAYLVRCVTRFVLQTLNKDQKYNYRSVFKA